MLGEFFLYPIPHKIHGVSWGIIAKRLMAAVTMLIASERASIPRAIGSIIHLHVFQIFDIDESSSYVNGRKLYVYIESC